MARKVLVTGGAGFVGSSLALELKARHPGWEIAALDNLRRRGSELNIPRLRAAGVAFWHGDIREPEDIASAGHCDLLLECSAEPSVLAGLEGSPAYVLQTNLVGTINCLEHARRCGAGVVFLSSSRVYPIARLSALRLRETDTRFELDPGPEAPPGVSAAGIGEDFPLEGARSIYGTTKLCSELLVQEYASAYDMPAVIDRCSLLAGPWQMGKSDQGVVTYWVASHVLQHPLTYIGYGGTGKQVRDVLHVADLAELVDTQLAQIGALRGEVFNVGGGRERSVSLRELTALCVRATGRSVAVGCEPADRVADVPYYVSDNGRVRARFGWQPTIGVDRVVEEIAHWVAKHRGELAATRP